MDTPNKNDTASGPFSGQPFDSSAIPGQGMQAGGFLPAGGREVPGLLPCQKSNNSIEPSPEQWRKVQSGHVRSAYALETSIAGYVEKKGVNCVGMLTLTFSDDVQDAREATRRLNSLMQVLRKRFTGGFRSMERTKAGRVHFHLCVHAGGDIRTGVNFAEFAGVGLPKPVYTSAGPLLRSHWAWLRHNLKKYGFGRAELLPIRTVREAFACYFSKYIAKHIGQREERDKGVRLWAAFGDAKAGKSTSRFTWSGIAQVDRRHPEQVGMRPGWAFRDWVRMLARAVGAETLDDLRRMFGKRWAWNIGRDVRIIKARLPGWNRTFLARAVELSLFGGTVPPEAGAFLEPLGTVWDVGRATVEPSVATAMQAFGGRVVACQDARTAYAVDWSGRSWVVAAGAASFRGFLRVPLAFS